ncbi:Hypothetical predicted protein [Mytilus galloprovincialis]|uniref:Uncharacterized protein n=1 Tax=Mytilus galloprovincialis TaxID=29158 RepID=A0A8B6FP25_MYTGA|nr:Hypothetical predicted protein [Mytilus galloprovincialis]
MKRLYLGNPLGVLYASEILDVNIRILCFPCIEEVNFYNQKPRNVTIHLGLIGQDTYVPIVSIVEITEENNEIDLKAAQVVKPKAKKR